MADKSDIGWTGATEIVDRGGSRVRLYFPQDPARPGLQLRRKMGATGFKWCRDCRGWLPAAAIRSGLCQPHIREDNRNRYATDADFRSRRQANSSRRRGVEAVPMHASENLLELFDGECAYCPQPATTWDHVLAVSRGGITTEGNILPCCKPCNSSKKDSEFEEWLDRAPTIKPYTIEYLSVFGRL